MDVEVSHKQFAERLGRLIDLSGSIALSRVHVSLAATASKLCAKTATVVSTESLVDEFIRVRTTIVQSIIDSFVPTAGVGVAPPSLPLVTAAISAAELTRYGRYQLFYVSRQKEIAVKLGKLRASTRAAVSSRSSRLAQLVVLDAALDEALSAPTQKLFAEIPRLLERRFQYLYLQHQQVVAGQHGAHGEDDWRLWSQAGGWLEQFTGEMQGLLLAELEVRIQPVLGLIEALKEEVERA